MTRDGLPSVHVEHTLALTPHGVEIITADEGAFDPDPAAAGARAGRRGAECRLSRGPPAAPGPG